MSQNLIYDISYLLVNVNSTQVCWPGDKALPSNSRCSGPNSMIPIICSRKSQFVISFAAHGCLHKLSLSPCFVNERVLLTTDEEAQTFLCLKFNHFSLRSFV